MMTLLKHKQLLVHKGDKTKNSVEFFIKQKL